MCPRQWQWQWVPKWGRTFLNTNWRGSFGGIMPSKQVRFVFVHAFVLVFVIVFEAALEELCSQNRRGFIKTAWSTNVLNWNKENRIESVQKKVHLQQWKKKIGCLALFVFLYIYQIVVFCIFYNKKFKQRERNWIGSNKCGAHEEFEPLTTTRGMRIAHSALLVECEYVFCILYFCTLILFIFFVFCILVFLYFCTFVYFVFLYFLYFEF